MIPKHPLLDAQDAVLVVGSARRQVEHRCRGGPERHRARGRPVVDVGPDRFVALRGVDLRVRAVAADADADEVAAVAVAAEQQRDAEAACVDEDTVALAGLDGAGERERLHAVVGLHARGTQHRGAELLELGEVEDGADVDGGADRPVVGEQLLELLNGQAETVRDAADRERGVVVAAHRGDAAANAGDDHPLDRQR